MLQEQGKTWAESEFAKANLGDKRLTRRLISIANDLAGSPTSSIPQACKTWANTKAAYRFFDNDNVDYQDIFASHEETNKKRIKDYSIILAVQDTTQIDFTNHPATKGLGILSDQEHIGILYHPTLLITPDKVPIGIADHQVWQRPPEDFGKKHSRKMRPVSEKESQKWLNSLEKTAQLQRDNPHCRFINIADREADIFDYFLHGKTLQTDIIVRAAWNRRIEHPDKYLWEHMENVDVLGTYTITVPRKPGQPPRKAVLSLRYKRLSLLPPTHRRSEKDLKPIPVWVVFAHEEDPPDDAEAVSWMLITTMSINSFDEAVTVVQWYTCRWQIEIFFKILKSGCRMESRQLEEAERLKRLLVIYAIVACRVLFLTMVPREMPDIPCDVLLELEEWQALYCFVKKTKKPPPKPPTLREATRMIAQLGGFLGRKSDGHPGPTVIWRGLQRLADIAFAWTLGKHPP